MREGTASKDICQVLIVKQVIFRSGRADADAVGEVKVKTPRPQEIPRLSA
jgi:hypothetical protein